MIRRTLALSLVLILAGCALSNVPPRSFSERVAAAYTGIAMTNDTAAILVNAGTVSKERGREVLERTREAREVVDIAAALKSEDRLGTALDLLQAAKEYLCKDKQTEPNCVYLLEAKP
jgi:hypothetical protein